MKKIIKILFVEILATIIACQTDLSIASASKPKKATSQIKRNKQEENNQYQKIQKEDDYQSEANDDDSRKKIYMRMMKRMMDCPLYNEHMKIFEKENKENKENKVKKRKNSRKKRRNSTKQSAENYKSDTQGNWKNQKTTLLQQPTQLIAGNSANNEVKKMMLSDQKNTSLDDQITRQQQTKSKYNYRKNSKDNLKLRQELEKYRQDYAKNSGIV